MFAESADGRVQSTVDEARPLTSHIPAPAISDGGRGLEGPYQVEPFP